MAEKEEDKGQVPESSKEQKEVKAEQKPEAEVSEQAEPTKEVQVSKDSRNMAMLCHLLGFFTSFIGPLVIWLVKKDEDSFVDDQGKEALNFQITIVIAMAVASLLTFICIGIPLLIAIPIVDLVFCIIASVKASSGVAYRYPLTIRFLK